jgi:hypothetical protein
MNASEILSDLAIQIYSPPLSKIRESGKISDLNSPISVLMLVIDFETEVSMNGIVDFIGNSTGRYASETVQALKVLRCNDAAMKLADLLETANAAGMTHDAIQRERQGVAPYTVTSFRKLHGEKWSHACAILHEIERKIDFGDVFKRAETFVDQNKEVILAAMKKPEQK